MVVVVAAIAALVAWMMSKCLASGLLDHGLKHQWRALLLSHETWIVPLHKSWNLASSRMVTAIPYKPEISLR